MRRAWVLHPFFFAVFPILFLFSRNLERDVSPRDLVWPVATTLAIVAVVLVAATLLLRDARKAGLVVSVWAILFFTYGHVSNLVRAWTVAGIPIGRQPYPLVVWGVLAVGAVVFAIRSGKGLTPLTGWLNIVSLILVAVNLVPVVPHRPGSDVTVPGDVLPTELPRVPAPAERRSGPPDIYYLVFDRYGGPESLRELVGVDNSAFYEALADRGFYVASESRANYPKTSHSLAASLNMRFLDFLSDAPGETLGPVYELVRKHEVGAFLKSQGYKYIHIASGWGPLQTSPIADRVLRYRAASEFSSVLFDGTLIGAFGEDLGAIADRLDHRRVKWRRTLFQFEQVVRTRGMRGPKFVFAHFLVPHGPYVFHRDGRFLSEEEEAERTWQALYNEQLAFTNSMILRVLDQLLAGPEGSDPVILLQADEGPHPDRYLEDQEEFSWTQANDRELRLKFGILNAYLLPGVSREGLYPSITPVNSFRLLFNLYFGEHLALLPDRSYVFTDLSHLYEFTDVTERLKT